MPSWIVPSDAHVTGDSGHTSDHNHVADDLTIVSGLVPVSATMAAGDLIIQNATPVPARLAVGSANNVLGVSGGLPAWQIGMTLQAQTAAAGVSLINGTQTFATWTTPNDGNIHHFIAVVYVATATTTTGGQVNNVFTDLAGTVITATFIAAAQTGGTSAWNNNVLMCKANTTVSVTQGTAMTAGAAKAWAEIWGC